MKINSFFRIIRGEVQQYSKIKRNIFLILSICLTGFLYFSCNNNVATPENTNPQNNSSSAWPQTITDTEKTTTASLKNSPLSDSLQSMGTIIQILSAHSSEEGVSQYKSTIEKVKSLIEAGNLSQVTGENVTTAVYQSFVLNDEIADNNYTNYAEYQTARTTAQNAITAYSNEYNSSESLYNVTLNAYRTAVSNISQPKYDAVAAFAKKTVEDFKDNYIFNETYNEDSIQNMVNEAKTEKTNVQSSLGTAYTNYTNAYNNLETLKTNASTAVNTYNSFVLHGSNGSEINTGNGGNSGNQGDEVTVTDRIITLGDALPTDWSNVGNVTIKLADNATEIDVFALAKTKHDVEEAFAENTEYNGSERTVSFASYPASATSYKLDMKGSAAQAMIQAAKSDYYMNITDEKDNVILLKYLAPVSKTTYASTVNGQPANGEIEVVPGVKVKSYITDWRGVSSNSELGNYRAFDFSNAGKTVSITLPSEYSLEKTKDGGIVGNVSFTNLSDTTISGSAEFASDFKNFYKVFVKNKSSSALAKLDGFGYNSGSENLYNTNFDDIIETYYKDSTAKGKILSPILVNGGAKFDGKDSLGGTTMYKADNFDFDAEVYELNVNAALVIGQHASISNVKVTGTNNVGEVTIPARLKNIRFVSDMNQVTITGTSSGVLDFRGEAPKKLTGASSAKVIFKKISNSMIFSGSRILDISSITAGSVSNISHEVSGNAIGKVYGNDGVLSGFSVNNSLYLSDKNSEQMERYANGESIN